MDLLDFNGEAMYFDTPVGPEVDELISLAAARYGEAEAEYSLLRAYFLEPEHLTVLVALYRYYYYRHRYADALLVADRAIRLTADRLGITPDWRKLSKDDLGKAVLESMSLTRFFLLALKGSGYLKLRLGDAADALERFEKVVAMDTSDRLGMSELLSLARAKVTEDSVQAAGGKVSFLRTP
jgi:tetratricopeptide (TPR) repeat protein